MAHDTVDDVNFGVQLKRICRAHTGASTSASVWQLVNTLIPFLGLWVAMCMVYPYSYAYSLVLAVPTAGFLVRTFILMHDCAHNAFFRSRTANSHVGFWLGVLTFTPFAYWRRSHNEHHAHNGNLAYRSYGEITVLTVDEYEALSPVRKLLYRIYRHPFVLFFVGAAWLFYVKHRAPLDMPWSWKREWLSVLATNVAIVVLVVLVSQLIGFWTLMQLHVPVTTLAGAAGIWLFYLQHNYEDTYWRDDSNWSFEQAALLGSSYFKLPPVLRWFSANIGLHHIHHLCSVIPNYKLATCHADAKNTLGKAYAAVTKITLRGSVACLHLRLWDANQKKLVPI